MGGYVALPVGKPTTIDLYLNAAKPDKVMKGICRLDGDTLTICFGEVAADRPTELRPDPVPVPPGLHYFVMKRAK